MNEGLPSEATPKMAESVTMITHNRGRKSPSALPMISAITLTTMVQVPSAWMGIMKMMMPIIEGMRNPAICFAEYLFIDILYNRIIL